MHDNMREFIQPPHHVLKWSLPALPTALGRPALLWKLTSRIPLWEHGLANSSGLVWVKELMLTQANLVIVWSLPWPSMALGSPTFTETDQWDYYMWTTIKWICLALRIVMTAMT